VKYEDVGGGRKGCERRNVVDFATLSLRPGKGMKICNWRVVMDPSEERYRLSIIICDFLDFEM